MSFKVTRKYGCLWRPIFLSFGCGKWCKWEIFGMTFLLTLIFLIFSSCTSSFCVSSSRPTSSRASAKRSSIRNLFFNFWNFSTAKILVSVTSSRLSSTGYTENSSGYGHSLGSKSTTFSSSKLPIDQLSQFATVSCQPIYMEMSFEMSFKHKLVYYCML